MCTVLRLPPLGIALPWQAPWEWALYLGMLIVLGLALWFAPHGVRRDPLYRQPMLRVLFLTGVTCLAAFIGFGLLVVWPASDMLDAWTVHVSQTLTAAGCSPEVWLPLEKQRLQDIEQLQTAFSVLFTATSILLVITGFLVRERRVQAQCLRWIHWSCVVVCASVATTAASGDSKAWCCTTARARSRN